MVCSVMVNISMILLFNLPMHYLSMKWQWTYGPTLLPWTIHFLLRPPRGVREAHLHLSYRPSVIRGIPSQTNGKGLVIKWPVPNVIMLSGLWWDCNNDIRSASLVKTSFTDPRGGLKEVLNRLRMYGNGYSMAIVLDHRSTALTETKIGEYKSTANLELHFQCPNGWEWKVDKCFLLIFMAWFFLLWEMVITSFLKKLELLQLLLPQGGWSKKNA